MSDQSNAEKVKQTARESAQDVKQQAQEAANMVKDEVSSVAQQAQSQLNQSVDQHTSQAADQVGDVASALRKTSRQLDEQDVPFAQYASQAADQIEKVQGYLQNANLNQMMQDAEDLAREQPEVFLGAAFAAGVMMARFFKSSAPANVNRRSTQQPRRNYAPAPRPNQYRYGQAAPTIPRRRQPVPTRPAYLVPSEEIDRS